MPIFWPFMKKISIIRKFPHLKTCFNLLQNIYRTIKHMDLTGPLRPYILFFAIYCRKLAKKLAKIKKILEKRKVDMEGVLTDK